MKRPRDAGEQLRNELLALDMVTDAPPGWLEFYRQVREVFVLEARAKAGNLPADNRRAAAARTELRYVMDALAAAEKDRDAPPIVFDFARKGGAT